MTPSFSIRTGAIKVGDRIIAINGESLLTKTIDDASWILRNAGNTVTLKISKGVVRRSKWVWFKRLFL